MPIDKALKASDELTEPFSICSLSLKLELSRKLPDDRTALVFGTGSSSGLEAKRGV